MISDILVNSFNSENVLLSKFLKKTPHLLNLFNGRLWTTAPPPLMIKSRNILLTSPKSLELCKLKEISFPCSNAPDVLVKFNITYIITSIVFLLLILIVILI